MRSNATCTRCDAPVRACVDEHGQEIILRPEASPLGYVYVLSYIGEDVCVKVCGTPGEVPAREALRYSIHLCDPKGGA